MRIALLVEGATEKALKQPLLAFLRSRLTAGMPKLDFMPRDGRLPKGDKLKKDVTRLLTENDAVIALTDVYTGSEPRDFEDAADAKAKMRLWVGDNPRFYAHCAQHDFEAWLLPYWDRIQELSGSDRRCPSAQPETVNHDKSPAKHLAEIFRTGSKRRYYSKVLHATSILRGQDLAIAAARCPELKAFLNTILNLNGGATL